MKMFRPYIYSYFNPTPLDWVQMIKATVQYHPFLHQRGNRGKKNRIKFCRFLFIVFFLSRQHPVPVTRALAQLFPLMRYYCSTHRHGMGISFRASKTNWRESGPSPWPTRYSDYPSWSGLPSSTQRRLWSMRLVAWCTPPSGRVASRWEVNKNQRNV